MQYALRQKPMLQIVLQTGSFSRHAWEFQWNFQGSPNEHGVNPKGLTGDFMGTPGNSTGCHVELISDPEGFKSDLQGVIERI